MLNLVLIFNLCNVGYKHCFLLKIWWFIIHYYGLLDNQSRSLPIKKKKSHINVSDYYFCANTALPEFPWHVNQQARRVTEVIRFFSKSTFKNNLLAVKKNAYVSFISCIGHLNLYEALLEWRGKSAFAVHLNDSPDSSLYPASVHLYIYIIRMSNSKYRHQI